MNEQTATDRDDVIRDAHEGYTRVTVTETTRHELYVRNDLFEEDGMYVDSAVVADAVADNLGFDGVLDRDMEWDWDDGE